MLLVGEYPCIPCFHAPIVIEQLHATHEISKLHLTTDLSIVNKNQNILRLLLHSDACKMINFLKSLCSDDHIYVVFMVRDNITHDISIRAQCIDFKEKN